jgi:hypothetical protein
MDEVLKEDKYRRMLAKKQEILYFRKQRSAFQLWQAFFDTCRTHFSIRRAAVCPQNKIARAGVNRGTHFSLLVIWCERE